MRGELMAAEMAEQPAVLAALAGRRAEVVEHVRACLPEPLAGVVLVARGSSDYAAVYGRYLLELAARRPVALAAPSLQTRYDARTELPGWVAVAVSQSGRTPEIVATLERLVAGGARGVAITNDQASPLAAAAGATIALGAGEERAVRWRGEDWESAIAAVAAVLADPAAAERAASRLTGADRLVALGRGPQFAVALEAALKLRETTGILAEGWSTADYLHGPIAASGEAVPALAVHADGPVRADVVDLASRLRERGSLVLELADDAGADLPVTGGLPEALCALPLAVRAQQLAHAVALQRGLDPDAPPGLAKITRT